MGIQGLRDSGIKGLRDSGVKEVRRCEGANVVLNFAWRTLREGIYHATVAKDAKVDNKEGVAGGLSGSRICGMRC